MRGAAPFSLVLVVCLAQGCSMTRSAATQHPGITELNPNAVVRTYPGSATQVAQKLADVMSQDAILDKVSMTPDLSREYRNFTRAERQALGVSMFTPGNDVNFNVTARSKDGHPVAAAVRLKGESSAEVSILYGVAGDPELSRDLLDKVAISLASPAGDPALARTAGPPVSSRKTSRR